ncbi:NnrU family protein [Celeribacter sp.]|uniref:NnrU family protein n=1 Tax=Celeribacter sp. TaxID=1890673 RepID=UPI003A950935
MSGWGEFISAFVVFFLSHAIPVRPPVKGRIVAQIGARGFTLGYSILSTAILIWLIVAAGRAPFVVLWNAPFWGPVVTLFVMFDVVMLLALTIGRPNPFSFGGAHNERFDPSHPEVVRFLRHPLLVGLALWAVAHIVPNGDLAHVILFGAFAGVALLGMAIINRRKRRQMGDEAYEALLAQTRAATWCPAPQARRAVIGRLAIGAVAYVGLVALHGPVIGVYPWP